MTTRMILNDLLNLFYPRLCLLCQRSLVEGEEHICLHCSNHLPYTHFTDMETNPVCLLLQGKTSFVAATALLHPKRMRQRGYNQSEWIAYGIRSATGIAVDTSSLSRIKKTESQTRKQIFERSENVEDIFRVENTDTLKNKHILLVDDVITTGSTMNACAEAMKAISGIRISILGIAVA